MKKNFSPISSGGFSFCTVTVLDIDMIVIADSACVTRCIVDPASHADMLVRLDAEKGMTRPLEYAVDFLMKYQSKKNAPLPLIDWSWCTESERSVYEALCRIPFGDTVSYGELAVLSGFPRGARFVGNTMAKNIIPVIIPCHRVICADGRIGNYSGGEWIKERLLSFERS